MRYAQVRTADGVVINVVEASEAWAEAQSTVETTFVADPNAEADIGGTYGDGVFTKPAPEGE